MGIDEQVAALCRDELATAMGGAGALRLQTAVRQELRRLEESPPRPVMTLVETADYLRVPPEVIEEELGRIPCFELGGKLLFRKEAVDKWIERQEKHLAYQIMEFDVKHELVGRA